MFNVDTYCKEHLGVKSEYFIYEGERYRVSYRLTYNCNLNNDGTSFVVGSKFPEYTEHLKIKSFLILQWD